MTQDAAPVEDTVVAPVKIRRDDKAMLRAAADVTRDLNVPDARLYWTDFLASAVTGYGALALAATTSSTLVMLLAGVVSILALFRAGSFIHELTHIKKGELGGFKLGWNLIVGVPLLIPLFLYEGIHNLHHAKIRYGTVEDPEYLPLALMRPWTLPVFLIAAALAPLALLFRFAVLAPLSLLVPRLRKLVVERYSGLQINPHFRRKPAEGELARQWRWQEAAASVWALSHIAMAVSGILPLQAILVFLAITSGTMLLNQTRTLVAHLWENDGEPLSVTEQFSTASTSRRRGRWPNYGPPSACATMRSTICFRGCPTTRFRPRIAASRSGSARTRPIMGNYGGLVTLVRRLAVNSWRGGPA